MTLTAPLANAQAAGAAVAGTAIYNTIALLIDTKGPVATWGTQATTLRRRPPRRPVRRRSGSRA